VLARVRWLMHRLEFLTAALCAGQQEDGRACPAISLREESRTEAWVVRPGSHATPSGRRQHYPLCNVVATNRTSSAMAVLKDFSAPTASTGIVSLRRRQQGLLSPRPA